MMSHPRGVGRPREPVPVERLQDAARDAFAANGYTGTSMRDIAELAGVRKASLFYRFGNKKALYLDVMTRVVADLQGYVGHALVGEGGFVERLDRLGGLIVGYLAAHPGAARLLVREMVDGGPFAAGPGREAIAATLERTTNFLLAGMQAGTFVERDPRQLALSIVGLHLFYFAAHETSTGFLACDVFSQAQVGVREQAVLGQVRSMVVRPDPGTKRRAG